MTGGRANLISLYKLIHIYICTEDECEKRHPNTCKFGPRCQFNKNNECFYLHVTLASDDQQIEALKAHFNSKFTKLDNYFSKIWKE